jgi:hypothetical protein
MIRPATTRLTCCAASFVLLAACEPRESAEGPPKPFRAPIPEPRRTLHPDPSNAQWLAAWRDLRSRLAPLEERLAELQEVHTENNFDAFLDLDPASLTTGQLCSLFHFLQRGYFTVERRVLVHLLERRLDRTASPLAIPANGKSALRDHLAAAMNRDEIRMVDIETAIDFYEQTGEANFQIPGELTEEEQAELRGAVGELLEEARSEIAELDAKIADLKEQAFGHQSPSDSSTPDLK